MHIIIVFVLTLALAAHAPGAFAAFKSANDKIQPEKAYNPDPMPDDISLPMPCGMQMVFRAVDIPVGSLINDKTFTMGINNAANEDRQLYERQFSGHISAPFTSKNLPGNWRGKLPKNTSSEDTFYFIGKYEVSQLQWQAVMDSLDRNGQEEPKFCPNPGEPGGNLPKGSISWFDAQEFLNKYNAWLVKKHMQQLPAFEGTQNIAFLRLPTEEEWEYAARGGTRVPAEWWSDKDIFPLADGKKLKDYGVYYSDTVLEGPAAIGSRNANPLGLHDTIGNLSEMVDGFFRMSIADMRNGRVERRLHGAAGGILTKGGSFRSDADAVMPGWRDEVPLYTARGPSRPQEVGMRLVLAGLNIPNAQRLDHLRAEERDVAKSEARAQSSGADLKSHSPMEAVDELAEAAEGNMKANLVKLKGMLKDWESAEARLNSRNIEQSFRSLLYQSETLRAFALRYLSANKEVDKIRSILNSANDDATRAMAKKAIGEASSDLSDYLRSLEMGANYYKSGVEAICRQPRAELERLVAQARREYGGEGVFNKHMRQNIDELEKNLDLAARKGLAAINQDSILKGILPDNHYRALPQKEK